MFATSATAQQPPTGVSGEEWGGIQEQIEVERHKVSESDRPGRLYRADNPVQRFTAHFGAEDVVIVPRGRGEPAWELGMRLTAWGAAHDLQPVHPAGAIAEDNRVEYRRGPLTEWYVNTTMGLEQGFTIEAPPADGITELVLEVTLDGDLTAELAGNSKAVTFRSEGSSAFLTYSGLASWDATGQALETRMELAGGGRRLRLVVGVRGIAWPVTIDPIFSLVAKLMPTPELDNTSAYFGYRIAVDIETLVVGIYDIANGEGSGAAHIFQRDPGGSTSWTHVTRIDADDGTAYDNFGRSVAISGDTVVVGAPYDDNSFEDSGSAYVFERDQGGQNEWKQAAKITAPDGSYQDKFGTAVAISGDTVFIGVPDDSPLGALSGSAYVFRRDHGGAGAWGLVRKIVPADGWEFAYFGSPISMYKDTAIVGASGNSSTFVMAGSAYIYHRDEGGPNAWGQIAKITPDDGAAYERFGCSVAIDDDTAVIGARSDDDYGYQSGSAYVFQRDQDDPNLWGQVAKIFAADGWMRDHFGTSVSISEDTVVVGSPFDDDNGDGSGSAYIFQRDHGGTDSWGQIAKITDPEGSENDEFGAPVRISGETVFVGVFWDDDDFQNSGSVQIFQRDEGGPNAWGQAAKLECPPVLTSREVRFGTAVSVSGDSAIVGAPLDTEIGPNSGAAYIFRRDPHAAGAWEFIAKLTASDGAADDQFGKAVFISGDRAIVGAPNGADSGAAYIFLRDEGGSNLWGQAAKLVAVDGEIDDQFGISVTVSGDAAVVGAPGDDDNGLDSGSAYVFRRDEGGADAWGQVAKILPIDGQIYASFGRAVSVTGDTAIIGAYQDYVNGDYSGSTYIFQRNHGGADAWGQIAKIVPADIAPHDQFGFSVSISDDIAVIGAPLSDPMGNDSGSAYLFQRDQGGPDAWGLVAKIVPAEGSAHAAFGYSVSISGDSVLAGAWRDDDLYPNAGSAYIFRQDQGGPSAWGQVAKVTPVEISADANFGTSVAISGDDAIVGAPRINTLGEDSGAAYVFTISDAFFADGFETGDTSAWSVVVP